MKDGPIFAMLVAAIICYCCGRDSEACERPPLLERVRAVLEQAPASQWDRDETAAERDQRLDDVSEAIDLAARDDSEAAALLAIGGAESNFAGYVVRGCHYPDGIPRGAAHCDLGKSRSPWQMKITACRQGWALPRGSDAALKAFAVCARKRFLGALKRCSGRHQSRDPIAGAMAGYRSISCTWEGRQHDGARARARLYRLRLLQLR